MALSHSSARRLLASLTGDEKTISALSRYIAEQEAPEDWSNETTAQCANRASNRAIEAISRVGTLTSDLQAANNRIATLEASQAGLQAAAEAMLLMIEEMRATMGFEDR